MQMIAALVALAGHPDDTCKAAIRMDRGANLAPIAVVVSFLSEYRKARRVRLQREQE